MTPDTLLDRATGHLAIGRVFGEPIERDGVTFIPVAVVMGGGGAGSDPRTGSGGGFGGVVRGIGAYTISNGVVRYRPAVDVSTLALVAMITLPSLARALGRRKRRATRTQAALSEGNDTTLAT